MNRPNLFVIGAPKCGTTALVEALRKVPEIYVPDQKEPRYFDAKIYYDYEEDYPLKSIKEYLALYENERANGKKYLLDGSVFNMYNPKGIQSILEMSPDAKFICILRDPVSASISMHAQRLKYSLPRMRETSDNFLVAWETLEERKRGKSYPKGCRNKFLFRYDLLYSYQYYLPELMALIRRENLFVERYEFYKHKPHEFYYNLSRFLNLTTNIVFDSSVVNPSVIVRPNSAQKLIAKVGERSHTIRNKLGWTGDRVNWFKKLSLGKSFEPRKIEHDDLCHIREKFKSTYDYMEDLNFYSDIDS